ncbi:TetR/AcrR family transcriptional regulator [Nocardiopsis sp. CNT312]|uniref:TetR/AcrR family transcriptional regulator n=1 Tax=Nocardiopsis sp. CNT312 TaxID=1137268 RepID=UPI00048AA0AF|nr:TetR/AcrR family transcriptional regulator [Nocardiopsis sp. CNT312]
MQNRSTRRDLIADTALDLIAERGLRGLTHRAVDEAAGLPPGSTSYHARTRLRLVEAALLWLVDQEEGLGRRILGPEPVDRPGVARVTARFLHEALTGGRRRTLARLELALEAGRSPDLREVYDRSGARLRSAVRAVLADHLGSPEPERHTRALLSWMEGVLFYSLVGAGSAAPPDEEELRASALEVLDGLLGPDRLRGSHPG